MARKGTGLAVAVGAAIAIGAVVAFASGKKRKADEADEADEETAEPSPVLPTGGVPPFVPPIQVSFPQTTPATPGTPPVGPPVVPQVPATPTEVPPVVELPDEDEDEEDEETEAESPTVTLPGGVKVDVPAPGTTVTLPGGIPVTVPSIPGVTAPPAQPTPPIPAIEQPSAVPPDTATLVAQMLADEAHPTAWKKKYPALGTWQAARGLKADQSFGPGSAQRMAQEIGTLPIIRFWPKGSLPQTALEPYREAIRAIAASAPEPRRSQLLMSANREQGQAFGTPPKPITQQVSLKQVAA